MMSLWRLLAGTIDGVPRYGHINNYLQGILNWVPVWQHHYRISSIVWHFVVGIVPTYFLELFFLTSACSGRQSLRLASRGDFVVSHAHTTIKQHRAFSSAWNSLPCELRSLPYGLSSS